MKFSSFGEKYTGRSGIVDLMADLGEALHTRPDMISMGGGNPARIAAVEKIYKEHLVQLLEAPDSAYEILGKYQSPQGDERLLKQLAALLRDEYGWPVTDRNVAISNGGQSAFYVLSNLLAGRFPMERTGRYSFHWCLNTWVMRMPGWKPIFSPRPSQPLIYSMTTYSSIA